MSPPSLAIGNARSLLRVIRFTRPAPLHKPHEDGGVALQPFTKPDCRSHIWAFRVEHPRLKAQALPSAGESVAVTGSDGSPGQIRTGVLVVMSHTRWPLLHRASKDKEAGERLIALSSPGCSHVVGVAPANG